MFNIYEINKELLNTLFNSNIKPDIRFDKIAETKEEFTYDDLQAIMKIKSEYTVLGLDIYKYSQFNEFKQPFIPFLFESLYTQTWSLIRSSYKYIFQRYLTDETDITLSSQKQYFISTGDGGYQIFETPLHAILYVLIFCTVLRFYNSGAYMKKLFDKIGPVELRYAITFDNIYKYNDNYYGSSIINNSRILSKDHLNRFLIDANVFNWFMREMSGIENLMSITLDDFRSLPSFADYNHDLINDADNALIRKNDIISKEGIKSLDVQKIGDIIVKEKPFNIYNIHIQAIIDFQSFLRERKIITISVGNLNIAGI